MASNSLFNKVILQWALWHISEIKSWSSHLFSTCWRIRHNPVPPSGAVLNLQNWEIFLSQFCDSTLGNSLPNCTNVLCFHTGFNENRTVSLTPPCLSALDSHAAKDFYSLELKAAPKAVSLNFRNSRHLRLVWPHPGNFLYARPLGVSVWVVFFFFKSPPGFVLHL